MVYFIPGLGADERAFQKLNLPGVELQHIHWIAPRENESLTTYTRRLLPQLNFREEIVLVGLSFGGLVAQELARQLPCKKVILISSVKSRAELGWPIRLARSTRLIQQIPPELLKGASSWMADYFLSIKSKEASRLLQHVIQDSDSHFIKWAVLQLLRWQQDVPPPKLVHIHGTADRIFPIKRIENPLIVNNGGHLMVFEHAEQVSKLLMQVLNE